jgi:hypothetical protein
MKTRVSVAVAALLVACLVSWSGIQETLAQPKEVKAPAAPKWEYKRAEFDVGAPSDAALNKLGEEGWELVTGVGGYPYEVRSGNTPERSLGYTKVIYVFKRPKQ